MSSFLRSKLWMLLNSKFAKFDDLPKPYILKSVAPSAAATSIVELDTESSRYISARS